jgi:MFS family permease
LGASDTVANLPTSAYFWASLLPVFIAARFHKGSATAPVLTGGCLMIAFGGLLVAAAMTWPAPRNLRLAVVILYGAMTGAGLGIRNVFIWDVVNRGFSQDLRGWAYSLSFGLGPLFAVVGSLLGQLLLSGEVAVPWPSPSEGMAFAHVNITPFEFPMNFAILFAATVPLLCFAAILVSQFTLPGMEDERPQTAFLTTIFESAAELRHDRVLLCAIVGYVLVEAGFTITNNLSLYTIEALHRPAEDYAGYQNALRFSFKMTAGFVLGWLLVRTHPKFGALTTGALCLAGIIWAIVVPPRWFLLCFGLLGAGELYGIYYPNYIVARSRPARLRQNMAMLQLLSLITSLAPAGFGALSDAFGLRTSFVAAACIVSASLVLVQFGLPARPIPPAAAGGELPVRS